MKLTPLLSLLVWLASTRALAQTPPTPATPPCADAEAGQLDFWLGRWDLRWEASPGTPAGSGSNTVTRELGGCVIRETFAAAPGAGGLAGESVSVYHPGTKRWRQTWVDNQGGYIPLSGGREGDRFVLVAGSAEGKPAQRMVFEAITPVSLTWRWQRSTDAGTTWADQWVIQYQRAPATTLYAVEIKTGPAWDAGKPPHEQAQFREHSAHLKSLRERGLLVQGARYADKGLILLRAASEGEAHALMQPDPSMQAGVFRYELHDFRVFYGGKVAPPARP